MGIVVSVLVLPGPLVARDASAADQGAPDPDSEVARLELRDVDWVRIDDRLIGSGDSSQVELLPASYRVEWSKEFSVSFMVDPRMKVEYVARETVVIAANHTYRLGAARSHGQGYQVFLWLEDVGTGEIVAGFKKPRELLPGQTNPREYVPPMEAAQVRGKHGAKSKYSRDEDVQSLFEAVSSSDLARIEELVRAGVDLEARDRDKTTALHRASLEGHRAVVELLLELGADVNARVDRADRRTALMIAASMGHRGAVDALLESPDIDVNAASGRGLTALHFATVNEHQEVSDLLWTHPAVALSDLQRRDERLEWLGDQVWELDIPRRLKNSLMKRVGESLMEIDAKKVVSQLRAFITKVEGAREKHLTTSVADRLIFDAEEIIEMADRAG